MFSFERDTIEHSCDAGRTWNVLHPHPRCAVVAQYLPTVAEMVIYDDGLGNLYRWRQGRNGRRISHG